MNRKPTLGKPDQRDLNENLAATHGLAHMIQECRKLFRVSNKKEIKYKDIKTYRLWFLNQTATEVIEGVFADITKVMCGSVSYVFIKHLVSQCLSCKQT